MKAINAVSDLAAKIDASFQELFSYRHGLDIARHIFIADDAKKTSVAETLVESSEENCFISIRISSSFASHVFETCSPFKRLQSANISLFSIVAEEVSHFQNICMAAQTRTPISNWDLELQSEFDKFLLAARLMKEQSGKAHTAPLARLLFDYAYNYSGEPIYEFTGNIAAQWWWSHINLYGDDMLEKPHVRRSLLEMRSLQGQAKLDYISSTQHRLLTRRSA